ncbi:hypothetical protein BOW53_16050, partial [Solemya pervernicosa gill symbiont]
GAVGINGRVKYLPLAWAWMPKTSFRKNSDSPEKEIKARKGKVSKQEKKLKKLKKALKKAK